MSAPITAEPTASEPIVREPILNKPIKVVFVALFGLTEPFFEIGKRLEPNIEAYFITSTMDGHRQLLAMGVDPARILNVAKTRAQVRRLREPSRELQKRIDEFECFGPTFSSIIMMSRFYRGESSASLMHYMALTAMRIEEFFLEIRAEWVIAEPTNAVELLATVVAEKNGIFFGNIGFARLPHGRLVMFSDVEERSSHRLADPGGLPNGSTPDSEQLRSAAAWLDEYRRTPSRPSYFVAQAANRPIAGLVRAGWRNASLLMDGLTGTNEINNFRFSDLIRLHAKPYFSWLKRRIIRIHTGTSWNGSRPYAVYFLHVCPERSVDVVASWFSNQLEVIRNLRRALASRYDLLVKEHPSATGGQPLVFYRELSKVPNVRLLHAAIDSRSLMRNAAFIATISGTSAFEAALLGTPALIFSCVFFRRLPLVLCCQSPSQLPQIVGQALTMKRSGEASHVVEFLADILANSVCSAWDGSGGSLPQEWIDSFCELLTRATKFQTTEAANAQKQG